ncbi:MAG: hypothetical protein JO316_14065 [Abitibacteriaceae bacterium]|nr:hypothetical protein [Abditibacteriaceae bacterium]MBV9866474.1 hypothetical protein [Abditibacteriaceae bacterium]
MPETVLPILPDDRFEWTPRDIARFAGRPPQCVTRCCRDLERRHKLRKTGGRWIFDHATANRIFHQVLKPENLGD